MDNRQMPVSIPLNRLKLTTVAKLRNKKQKLRKMPPPLESDAHLLLNLSKTVTLQQKISTESENVKPGNSGSETNEHKTPEEPAKKPKEVKDITNIEKNDTENSDKFFVSKEDFELVDLVKKRGLSKSDLSIIRKTEVIDLDDDMNNNSEGQSNHEKSCLENEDGVSDKIICQSDQNKSRINELMKTFQNEKDNPEKYNQDSISSIVYQMLVNDKKNNNLTFDKSTQTPRDIMDDDAELERKRKETNLQENGIEDTEMLSLMEMGMNQVPISPVSFNQNNIPIDSYPSTQMMSALELPEHSQSINNNWNSIYGARGTCAESNQRFPMQKKAAAVSNAAALSATAFTPQHFPTFKNAEQPDMENVPAFLATACERQQQYARALNNQDQRALKNTPAARSNSALLAAAAFTPQQCGGPVYNHEEQRDVHNVPAAPTNNATLTAAAFNSQQYKAFNGHSAPAPLTAAFNPQKPRAAQTMHAGLMATGFTPHQFAAGYNREEYQGHQASNIDLRTSGAGFSPQKAQTAPNMFNPHYFSSYHGHDGVLNSAAVYTPQKTSAGYNREVHQGHQASNIDLRTSGAGFSPQKAQTAPNMFNPHHFSSYNGSDQHNVAAAELMIVNSAAAYTPPKPLMYNGHDQHNVAAAELMIVNSVAAYTPPKPSEVKRRRNSRIKKTPVRKEQWNNNCATEGVTDEQYRQQQLRNWQARSWGQYNEEFF